MKKLLLKIMYALIITTLCCWITVGLLTHNVTVLFVLGFIAICVAVYFIADTLEYVLKFILYCSKHNSKKKMKTNEVRLKVELVRLHDKTETPFNMIFLNNDLTKCIQNMLSYAKNNHCLIKSITKLTTE